MLVSRTSRLVAITTAALSFSACGYDCGVAHRTTATGTVRDAGDVTLGIARGEVSDHVGPSFLRLSVSVDGPSGSNGGPLRGHVTRARLVSESGELLAEVPTSTETLYINGVVALNADLISRSDYDRIRNALLTTRTKVVLDTNLPGREHIETTLSNVSDAAGEVNRCQFGA